MRCGSFRANGRTVYGFCIGLSVLVRPEFCVAKLASLVVVFSNLLCFFHWFIGLGSPSSFALQNSKVECDVPSERRVMYPPNGG